METKGGLPDLLVVIDGNLVGVAPRREVEEVIDASSFPRVVVGVPDPCVEPWYLADPPSFAGRFGAVEHVASGSDEWKQELEGALERAGEIVTAGGVDERPAKTSEQYGKLAFPLLRSRQEWHILPFSPGDSVISCGSGD